MLRTRPQAVKAALAFADAAVTKEDIEILHRFRDYKKSVQPGILSRHKPGVDADAISTGLRMVCRRGRHALLDLILNMEVGFKPDVFSHDYDTVEVYFIIHKHGLFQFSMEILVKTVDADNLALFAFMLCRPEIVDTMKRNAEHIVAVVRTAHAFKIYKLLVDHRLLVTDFTFSSVCRGDLSVFLEFSGLTDMMLVSLVRQGARDFNSIEVNTEIWGTHYMFYMHKPAHVVGPAPIKAGREHRELMWTQSLVCALLRLEYARDNPVSKITKDMWRMVLDTLGTF